MNVSRRALLASSTAAILPGMRLNAVSVVCTLEESQSAFKPLRPFVGPPAAGRVLVETSGGFAAESLLWLRRFGISVGEPIAVPGPSWVRFSWPIPAMIRDFGRVRPVTGGDVIARLGDLPVAVRCDRLIVLGSPLGPHIYAGDHDAGLLLDAILRSTSWAQ